MEIIQEPLAGLRVLIVDDDADIDLAMPVESGVALVRELRRASGASASLPIIAVTAYPDLYRPALPEAGFDRVITKPLSPRDLVRAVMELTGNRRRGRRHS